MKRACRWSAAAFLMMSTLACGNASLPDYLREMDAGPDAAPLPDGPPTPTTFPSCRELAATCGPGGTDDCCTSLEIPGGTFFRSYDCAGDSQSGAANFPATVSSFRLDRYEVTVGRFRAFVKAGMGTQQNPPKDGSGAHAALSGSGWRSSWNDHLPLNSDELLAHIRCDGPIQTWTDVPEQNESRPMNCLSWEVAMAFCIWDGGYLPTEAEWNYAAAGGSEQRAYPWSKPASSLGLSYFHASYHNGSSCLADGMAGCTASDLVPVGSLLDGRSRWGHMELVGNVREWILDRSGDYPVPCYDCAILEGNTRTARGGSFKSDHRSLRSSSRADSVIEISFGSRGARCARAASPEAAR